MKQLNPIENDENYRTSSTEKRKSGTECLRGDSGFFKLGDYRILPDALL